MNLPNSAFQITLQTSFACCLISNQGHTVIILYVKLVAVCFNGGDDSELEPKSCVMLLTESIDDDDDHDHDDGDDDASDNHDDDYYYDDRDCDYGELF